MYAMLAKLRNTIVLQYADTTPVETLLRHHRLARRFVYSYCALTIIAMSSIADMLFFHPSSTLSIYVTIVSCVLATVLTLPGILGMFWGLEIERVLKQRGAFVSCDRSIEKRVGVAAMKVIFWFAVLLLGVRLIHM